MSWTGTPSSHDGDIAGMAARIDALADFLDQRAALP